VKSELENLCANCSSKPRLFIVPGNHDLRLWDNVRIRLWPAWLDRQILPVWFERIIFNDTTIAKQKIEQDLNIELRLNGDCGQLTGSRWLKRSNRTIRFGATLRMTNVMVACRAAIVARPTAHGRP
jgi:hypothetical protein